MCPMKLVAKSMGFDYIQRPSTSPRSIRRFLETVHLKEPIAGYYFLSIDKEFRSMSIPSAF